MRIGDIPSELEKKERISSILEIAKKHLSNKVYHNEDDLRISRILFSLAAVMVNDDKDYCEKFYKADLLSNFDLVDYMLHHEFIDLPLSLFLDKQYLAKEELAARISTIIRKSRVANYDPDVTRNINFEINSLLFCGRQNMDPFFENIFIVVEDKKYADVDFVNFFFGPDATGLIPDLFPYDQLREKLKKNQNYLKLLECFLTKGSDLHLRSEEALKRFFKYRELLVQYDPRYVIEFPEDPSFFQGRINDLIHGLDPDAAFSTEFRVLHKHKWPKTVNFESFVETTIEQVNNWLLKIIHKDSYEHPWHLSAQFIIDNSDDKAAAAIRRWHDVTEVIYDNYPGFIKYLLRPEDRSPYLGLMVNKQESWRNHPADEYAKFVYDTCLTDVVKIKKEFQGDSSKYVIKRFGDKKLQQMGILEQIKKLESWDNQLWTVIGVIEKAGLSSKEISDRWSLWLDQFSISAKFDDPAFEMIAALKGIDHLATIFTDSTKEAAKEKEAIYSMQVMLVKTFQQIPEGLRHFLKTLSYKDRLIKEEIGFFLQNADDAYDQLRDPKEETKESGLPL
ncbi:MAG: hypothetical protein ACTSXG_02380, partial [Alphaproteobacteria bacterium]